MNRKLIFFDIDGTIIPEDTGVIPESTKEAIKKQKKTGIWFLLIQDVLLAELPSRFLIWNLMVMSADVERIFILMERKSIPL